MILIADDHDDTRNVLLRLFKLDGYETVSARSGIEALQYLANHIPTLIFTDYEMPEMDGLDLVIAIKRDPRLSGVPIVMYTAHESVKEDALSTGVDGFIVKTMLDWSLIRKEVVRLIGPGRPSYPVPPANRVQRPA